MKIFEIRNATLRGTDRSDKVVGYLFYYERAHRFFAEIPEGIDEWEAPFMFFGFVQRGIRSIDSEQTMKFVRQRIIPAERQNIGMILKENGLKAYDEYKLLILSGGRCAQDELYILRTEADALPEEIKERFSRKVKDVIPLSGARLMVFYRDGLTVCENIGNEYKEDLAFGKILRDVETFNTVRVSPGGNGIEWGENLFLSAEEIRKKGKKQDVAYDDMIRFVQCRLTDTTGACTSLGITRQYLAQLADHGRITPVLSGEKSNIYLKSELEGL